MQNRNALQLSLKHTHSLFLYGDISEMNKKIIKLIDIGVVFYCTKSPETQPVPVIL